MNEHITIHKVELALLPLLKPVTCQNHVNSSCYKEQKNILLAYKTPKHICCLMRPP